MKNPYTQTVAVNKEEHQEIADNNEVAKNE